MIHCLGVFGSLPLYFSCVTNLIAVLERLSGGGWRNGVLRSKLCQNILKMLILLAANSGK